ncbi:hypothetical protein C9374_013011 [Naegleria lovaniensis]|uniref:Uncharacterized protein n=1 Tax=Naegleria lovaniensis TaxID=51637 RepID=A0AA88KE69_NAELO|nr:uncharacterized protein C9374_013011 [Naegleria lovaniensis]KAG2372981.1 hypothetical protein C9374_013011 [Naegleria lovaniensis]
MEIVLSNLYEQCFLYSQQHEQPLVPNFEIGSNIGLEHGRLSSENHYLTLYPTVLENGSLQSSDCFLTLDYDSLFGNVHEPVEEQMKLDASPTDHDEGSDIRSYSLLDHGRGFLNSLNQCSNNSSHGSSTWVCVHPSEQRSSSSSSSTILSPPKTTNLTTTPSKICFVSHTQKSFLAEQMLKQNGPKRGRGRPRKNKSNTSSSLHRISKQRKSRKH